MVRSVEDRMAADVGGRTHEERSLTMLIKELRDETITLMRQEVALAKTEMSEKGARVGRNVASLCAGGLVAYAGLIFLLLAATAGIYLGLIAADLAGATALWVAPLIVGAVVLVIGYSLIQKGINTLKRERIVPERTADSLQRDKEWMKGKVRQ